MLEFSLRTVRRTSPVEAEARVGSGEILCLIGQTGAGKTTLLRLLAGHEPALGSLALRVGTTPSHGAGVLDLLALPSWARGLAYVPQRPAALWPRTTVSRSLDLVARLGRRPNPGAGPPGPEDPAETREAILARLRLDALRDRPSGRLSGGELQRLALAQAFASRPNGLLLDEPLSQQDPVWRRDLMDRMADTIRILGIPALWATHDLPEAQRVATAILALDEGHVVWAGSPDELLTRPATRHLARLVGYVAFLPAPDGTVVGVHPDRAVLDPAPGTLAPRSVTVSGIARQSRPFGGRRLLRVEPDGGAPFEIALSADAPVPADGARVRVVLLDPPHFPNDAERNGGS